MTTDSRMLRTGCIALLVLCLAGCASSAKNLPYPAFIDVDSLPGAFIANLPGVRAKLLSGNPDTRQSSSQVTIPANWEFTTGASPAQSVEIFVLAGTLILGDIPMTAGGYAYLPPGFSGMQIRSDSGARILYFLDGARPGATIQTPLITNAELVHWSRLPSGFDTLELRTDPGSGTRTWLTRVQPGAQTPWQRDTHSLEGYLVSGRMTGTECAGDKPVTGNYEPGGYFLRPAGAIHGGPDEISESGAVWFYRSPAEEHIEIVDGCGSP